MSDLQNAIRLSLEGPLHEAIEELEKILRKNPQSKTAVSYLADVYARLGEYEKALSVLENIRLKGEWNSTLEEQKNRLERIQGDLKEVERERFDRGGFICKAIVPDGKGGYLVDTLGFTGTWKVFFEGIRDVNPAAYLRFLKSLAWITERIKSEKIRWNSDIPPELLLFSGSVKFVSKSKRNPISVSLLRGSDGNVRWSITAEIKTLGWEREDQRNYLAEEVQKGSLNFSGAEERKIKYEVYIKRPLRVVLISLGLASDYAIALLCDRLKDKGFPTHASHVRSLQILDEYLDEYRNIPAFGGHFPDVFAISVLDDVIEQCCYTIGRIREAFPDACIIVGGPSSQTPEQFASLVPDFDVMIRGDADEILAQVIGILGQSENPRILSEVQVEAFTQLPGGLIVQQPDKVLVHRLDHTNVPSRYHLPRPRKNKTIYFWQTSRGCPYDCRFCNKWSGRRYRVVVPWDDDSPELPISRRSALAMIEFLLTRLAMEWPEEISMEELKKILRKTRDSDLLPKLLPASERILIVIEDDDFLIDRERVREFCQCVDELGLQRFFTFTAITSVRTLHRGKDKIDKELIGWLKKANFTSLDIGSDGLCQDTIDQNQKGYTLDKHVIPLNAYLKKKGFFAFNNTIITTPYTTIPQLVESLIFYVVCPYPINIAIEVGIMGHIGNRFTNEDIVNQQYNWTSEIRGTKGLHFKMIDNYRVPVNYPEYALNGSHIISYADPKVRDLIVEFPNHDPIDFLRTKFSEKDIEDIVNLWRRLPDDRMETKALGEAIWEIYRRNRSLDIVSAIARVKEDMAILNIASFCDYCSRLRSGEIEKDPLYETVGQGLYRFHSLRKKGNLGAAEQELKLLLGKAPWYFRLYQELIITLGNQGKIAEALEYFARYQLIEPDLRFYFTVFPQFLRVLRLEDAIREQSILFPIPRYFVINPIYYFLASIWELAGGSGKVDGFRFSKVKPGDIDRLYNLFDFLTIDIIKEVILKAGRDLSHKIRHGREVVVCGIPIRVNSGNISVYCDRINLAKALEAG